MRIQVQHSGVLLWLSEADTYRWAGRAEAAWPNSSISGFALFAEFDVNGLVDVRIGGRRERQADPTEFNAITSDHLRDKLPKNHPAYPVAVGQFPEPEARKAAFEATDTD